MDNRTIADWLLDYAHFLDARQASLYRIRAYRRAAETILGLNQPAAGIVEADGHRGLRELPGIGPHLAYTIAELVRTGEFHTLDQPSARRGAVDNDRAPCHSGGISARAKPPGVSPSPC